METTGGRIRRLRKEILDKTQKEFGERIGLKPNSVSDIESGKNNLTEQTANAICREFGINKDWLLTGDGEPTRDMDIDFGDMCADIGINDPKAKEAIAKYYELSPEDKKLFWNFMERFMK